jgi:DNA-binding transcriptional MerR regulator
MGKSGVKAEAVPEIPDKLYFRIGEVSRLIAVPAYVLRYWETEFPSLAPKKSGTGHRLYRRKEVELLLEIKQLLYEKRYTIEGARQHLQLRGKPARRERTPKLAQGDLFSSPPAAWQLVRQELASILELLK